MEPSAFALRLTKIEVFPLPRIDDSLYMLSKSKYFSTFDLDSSFWQVPVEQVSKKDSFHHPFRILPIPGDVTTGF